MFRGGAHDQMHENEKPFWPCPKAGAGGQDDFFTADKEEHLIRYQGKRRDPELSKRTRNIRLVHETEIHVDGVKLVAQMSDMYPP